MVICLEQGADLHMAQLMPLPLTVSCFSKIQIGFTFLEPAHLGSPGKGPLNGCVLSGGVRTHPTHAPAYGPEKEGSGPQNILAWNRPMETRRELDGKLPRRANSK